VRAAPRLLFRGSSNHSIRVRSSTICGGCGGGLKHTSDDRNGPVLVSLESWAKGRGSGHGGSGHGGNGGSGHGGGLMVTDTSAAAMAADTSLAVMVGSVATPSASREDGITSLGSDWSRGHRAWAWDHGQRSFCRY
jgi:hypothetical protein